MALSKQSANKCSDIEEAISSEPTAGCPGPRRESLLAPQRGPAASRAGCPGPQPSFDRSGLGFVLLGQLRSILVYRVHWFLNFLEPVFDAAIFYPARHVVPLLNVYGAVFPGKSPAGRKTKLIW